MNALEFSGVGFGYRGVPLFRDFNLAVEQGEFLGVIGPNGAGKSTLLRLAAGILRPERGRVMLLGGDVGRTPSRELARKRGVVLQESSYPYDFTVREVVMMGRNPYLGRFSRPGRADSEKVRQALEFVDAAGLEGKSINDISGGERQRVVLARALAQEPEVLLLDEATSHLDIAHQQSIVRILGRLNAQGKTIILLTHDLNLAALYCSRILLLDRGRAVACGAPDEVVTRELVAAVYGITPILSRHPQTGRPQVVMPA
jgi:iron complex transport system ATP-binding protein